MNTYKHKKVNISFKIVFVLALCMLGIYLEDYVRGAGLAIGVFILVIGWIIEKLLNKFWGYDYHFLKWTGIGLSLVFFCALGQGVHITEEKDGVKIYSPFLKRVIDSGQRIEKISLYTYYTRSNLCYNIESEEFFLLYHIQGDSNYISIYNTHEKVLELPDSCFSIEKINGSHGGEFQFIRCRDKDYFLRGSMVNDTFYEDVVDITPEYL